MSHLRPVTRYDGVVTVAACLELQKVDGADSTDASPLMCPPERRVAVAAGRYTVCHGFCHDQSKARRPDLCDGTRIHSGTKYGRPVFQVYDALTGTCRLWSRDQRYEGAHGCVHYLGGTWYGGRTFDAGQYTTRESCERGMCAWDEHK